MCLSSIHDTGQLWPNRARWLVAWICGLGPQPLHIAAVQDKDAGNLIPSTYGEPYRPYSTPRKAQNMNFKLARRDWVERPWVYSRHYPRIFVAPKCARNAETKRWPGAVPILLLAILASTTSAYSSLGVLQGLNPQYWLLKASVYHSATSAVQGCVSLAKLGDVA